MCCHFNVLHFKIIVKHSSPLSPAVFSFAARYRQNTYLTSITTKIKPAEPQKLVGSGRQAAAFSALL